MVATALPYMFSALMICAAVWDLATLRIPNWLSIASCLLFTVAAFALPMAVAAVALRLALGAAIIVIGFFMFSKGLVGGGDVKFLAATSLWVGWSALPAFLLTMALIGGALALSLTLIRRLPFPAAFAAPSWVRRLRQADAGVPYGLAIGAAGLSVLRVLPAS